MLTNPNLRIAFVSSSSGGKAQEGELPGATHSPLLVVAISTPAGAVRHISTERRKYKCVIFIWVAQNVVKVMTFDEDIKIDRK